MSIKNSLKKNKPKITSVKNVGVSHDTNPQHRESMEDEYQFIDKFAGVHSQGFFGIYDGHGGTAVAEFIERTLHKYFLAELKSQKVVDIKAAFSQSYLKTDQEIIDKAIKKAGTTAVNAFIRVNEKG